VGSGVPGSTFSIRKLNSYPAATHAVDADTRVLTPSVLQQALLAELAGASVAAVDWAGAATGFAFNAGDNVVSRLGPYVFTIAGVNGGIQPTNVHVLNLSTRAWHIVSNPSDGAVTGLQQIASGQDPTTLVVAVSFGVSPTAPGRTTSPVAEGVGASSSAPSRSTESTAPKTSTDPTALAPLAEEVEPLASGPSPRVVGVPPIPKTPPREIAFTCPPRGARVEAAALAAGAAARGGAQHAVEGVGQSGGELRTVHVAAQLLHHGQLPRRAGAALALRVGRVSSLFLSEQS
jgi:hypothetical protein